MENARRVSRAFRRFGVPMIEVHESDFASAGLQYAIGMPPSQIDFLTSLPGVDFDAAWQDRSEATIEGIDVPFLGLRQLVAAKASWRKQAGLMHGGPCDVRVLTTPSPQKRRGAVGLFAHLEGRTVGFPKVKRHTMPFK